MYELDKNVKLKEGVIFVMKNEFKTDAHARIGWIDAVKAFAIFCIVLGHAINGNGVLWHIVYGFHVPLFLILGGLNFSCKETSFRDFVVKKFRSIMIPYYFWGIISIFIYIIVANAIRENGALNFFECILGLVAGTAKNGYMHWNTPMWYLPMYFCVQIISYHLFKYNPGIKIRILYGVVAFVIAWGGYFSKPDLLLPFGLSSVIFLYPFFVCGTILKTILSKIDDAADSIKVFIASGMISVSIIIILIQNNIDYVTDVYRCYPLFVISAIGMSLGSIIIIKEYIKCGSIIKMIGSYTLGIMILQKFPLFFFIHFCPGCKELYSLYPQLMSVFISIITVIGCAVFSKFACRYIPWAFGRIKYIR